MTREEAEQSVIECAYDVDLARMLGQVRTPEHAAESLKGALDRLGAALRDLAKLDDAREVTP